MDTLIKRGKINIREETKSSRLHIGNSPCEFGWWSSVATSDSTMCSAADKKIMKIQRDVQQEVQSSVYTAATREHRW